MVDQSSIESVISKLACTNTYSFLQHLKATWLFGYVWLIQLYRTSGEMNQIKTHISPPNILWIHVVYLRSIYQKYIISYHKIVSSKL